MTMRLFCVIGIGLSGLVSLFAPHYQVTAEVVSSGFMILALAGTRLIQED